MNKELYMIKFDAMGYCWVASNPAYSNSWFVEKCDGIQVKLGYEQGYCLPSRIMTSLYCTPRTRTLSGEKASYWFCKSRQLCDVDRSIGRVVMDRAPVPN